MTSRTPDACRLEVSATFTRGSLTGGSGSGGVLGAGHRRVHRGRRGAGRLGGGGDGGVWEGGAAAVGGGERTKGGEQAGHRQDCFFGSSQVARGARPAARRPGTVAAGWGWDKSRRHSCQQCGPGPSLRCLKRESVGRASAACREPPLPGELLAGRCRRRRCRPCIICKKLQQARKARRRGPPLPPSNF